jgi:hypothetical protein
VPIYPGINHIKPGSLLLPLPICDTLIKGGKGAIFNERLAQKSKLADGESRLLISFSCVGRSLSFDCHLGVVNSPDAQLWRAKTQAAFEVELFLVRLTKRKFIVKRGSFC